VILDPDWTYVEPGKQTEFSLTGFVNDKMVGGVNLIAIRKIKHWLLSAHIGYVTPLSTFKEYYDYGYSLFIDVGYYLNPKLSVIGLLGYNWFSAAKNQTVTLNDTYWINLNVDAQYRYYLGNNISGYVRGGPGYYVPKTGQSKYGANIGMGGLYHFNNSVSFSLGIEYHNIIEGFKVYNLVPSSTENVQFLIIHAGIIINL
jgi:hypothetical protein